MHVYILKLEISKLTQQMRIKEIPTKTNNRLYLISILIGVCFQIYESTLYRQDKLLK